MGWLEPQEHLAQEASLEQKAQKESLVYRVPQGLWAAQAGWEHRVLSVCRGAEGTQDLLDPQGPKENLELMETWVAWVQRVCLGNLAWRDRRGRSACMATQDWLATVGSQDTGEKREKLEPEAHRDSLEKLVPRPHQAALVHEVLLAPRGEQESRVLGGSQGCRELLVCGGCMACLGSPA